MKRSEAIWRTLCAASTLAVGACGSPQGTATEETETTASALNQPTGPVACVLGTTSVRLAGNVAATGGIATDSLDMEPGAIANGGANINNVGGATVRISGATINGTVDIAGPAPSAANGELTNGGAINGAVFSGAGQQATLSTRTVTPGSKAITVNANGPAQTLAPGAYAAVTLNGSTTTFTAGTYNLASITVNAGSAVVLDTSGGAISINVQGRVIVNGGTFIAGDPAAVTFYSNSSATTLFSGAITVNAAVTSFPGNLVAPSGAVTVGSSVLLEGCIAAKIVDIEADSTIVNTGPGQQENVDGPGLIESDSTNGFNPGATDGFFASLGTNGRTCNTCHVVEDGWTITPLHAQLLANNDPLFAPVDGSDCPPTTALQGPNKSLSTQLVDFALIRIEIGIPSTSNFSLVAATNPEHCAIAPGSSGANGNLFLFRRPLPSTNLVFNSTIMWDGRENLEKITTTAPFQSEGPLLFDLNDQANSATTGHAQGPPIVGTAAQADIVTFETNVYTGQSDIGLQLLDVSGANGGAAYIANVLAPAFSVGLNDPLQAGFTNADFSIYKAWEPTTSGFAALNATQQAIGRGEALFNDTTFVIHDVPGLNSVPSDPFYNPADPLAGQDITGGCAVCHNSPNIGNHSTSLALNIGVTMAQPVNNDGSPNNVLSIARLPVYTVTNGTSTVAVTDAGRGLITGNWTDVAKTKGPILRGLSSRAPYFHNGSAKDLPTVVQFYNERFNIGFTNAQISDLSAFLGAL